MAECYNTDDFGYQKRTIGGKVKVTKHTTDGLPVYTYNLIEVVRTSDMSRDHGRDFEGWMAGQTRPHLSVFPMEQQDFSYVWDYERFLAYKAGKKVVWD